MNEVKSLENKGNRTWVHVLSALTSDLLLIYNNSNFVELIPGNFLIRIMKILLNSNFHTLFGCGKT